MITEDSSHQKYFMMGKHSYFASSFMVSDKTVIGKYCSISHNVCIGPGSHPKHFLSTHPFQYDPDRRIAEEYELKSFETSKPCRIMSDVWIGMNVIVLDGITIGCGAIVGANTVVVRDVDPYEIFTSKSPTSKDELKNRRYRFEEHIRKDLVALRWWDLPESVIKDLPFDDIHQCIIILKQLRGYPESE